MNDNTEQLFRYDYLSLQGTGAVEFLRKGQREIQYPFDKYLITVLVNSENEFIGITNVEVNKEYISYKRETIPKGYHDVDEYYPD